MIVRVTWISRSCDRKLLEASDLGFSSRIYGKSPSYYDKPTINGAYRDLPYRGCHGGPKLKLMYMGMAGVGCWCLHTFELVHTVWVGHACARWRERVGGPAMRARETRRPLAELKI
jgi:hypothetical protein